VVLHKYWETHFFGEIVEEALLKAITKLRHPEKPYVAYDGRLWKAAEKSIYESSHIRRFLKAEKEVKKCGREL